MLPRIDGFDRAAQVARIGRDSRVLSIRARSRQRDRVQALNLSADDYLDQTVRHQANYAPCINALSRAAPHRPARMRLLVE
jgi:DNA-binding response OmpR family regulator